MARRGKFEYWLTDDGLTLLGGWARDGLTDEQIAHNMGISRSTLSEWKYRYNEISDTLKANKEIVDYKVENALLEKALNGDTTAQIFWLKNRRPDKWRDKPVEAFSPVDTMQEDELSKSLRELAEGLEGDT